MAPHTRGPFFGCLRVFLGVLTFDTPMTFTIGCMSRELLIGDQKICVDREATLALYRDHIKSGAADQCKCASCRNFALHRGVAYPEHFLLLLNELGADPEKKWEAFDYDFETRLEHHLYGGWFLFSGEIVGGADSRPPSKTFSYCFTTSFPNGELPRDITLCAVEFRAEVPWIVPATAPIEREPN